MLRRFLLIVLAVVMLCSCRRAEAGGKSDAVSALEKPETIDDSFSYAVGYLLASSLSAYGENLDYGYTAKGVIDAASGSGYFTYEEIQGILSDFQRTRMAEAQDAFEAERAANREKSEEFLAANKQRNSVITTSSGLQYEMLEEGEGKDAEPDSVVAVNYTLTLYDGTLAFSTYDDPEPVIIDLSDAVDDPEPVIIDLSDAVPGFSEGVGLMKEGGRIRLWVPPRLGYGSNAPSPIGPDMLLIFDIDLIEVIDE